MTRVEIIEQATKVVVEEPYYHVRAENLATSVVSENTTVVVQTPAPEVSVVRVEKSNFTVVPQVTEVRIVSVGEQGPPGTMVRRVYDATWASSLLIDWAHYDLYRVELAGPLTEITFSGASDGQPLILELEQDATGGRLITFLSSIRYSTLIPSLTLSTAPGSTDRLGFMYNASTNTYDLMALARGF